MLVQHHEDFLPLEALPVEALSAGGGDHEGAHGGPGGGRDSDTEHISPRHLSIAAPTWFSLRHVTSFLFMRVVPSRRHTRRRQETRI
jgi:hypothetical protein